RLGSAMVVLLERHRAPAFDLFVGCANGPQRDRQEDDAEDHHRDDGEREERARGEEALCHPAHWITSLSAPSSISASASASISAALVGTRPSRCRYAMSATSLESVIRSQPSSSA